MCGGPPVSEGWRTVTLGDVDSTNAEALRRAHQGERGPVWIRALSQSHGRGRQGREWVSEPGNLYASLLLTEPVEPRRLTQLSFVTALAVHDTASACLEDAPDAGQLTLKWPNDVLLDGAKISGILLESTNLAPDLSAIVVGVGLNVRHHPATTLYPTTHLRVHGARADVAAAFEALMKAFKARYEQWRGGEGFAVIRDLWLERAQGMGQKVNVALPDRTLTGVFAGLADDGAMMLRMEDGTEHPVLVGDLFLPNAGRDAARPHEE